MWTLPEWISRRRCRPRLHFYHLWCLRLNIRRQLCTPLCKNSSITTKRWTRKPSRCVQAWTRLQSHTCTTISNLRHRFIHSHNFIKRAGVQLRTSSTAINWTTMCLPLLLNSNLRIHLHWANFWTTRSCLWASSAHSYSLRESRPGEEELMGQIQLIMVNLDTHWIKSRSASSFICSSHQLVRAKRCHPVWSLTTDLKASDLNECLSSLMWRWLASLTIP